MPEMVEVSEASLRLVCAVESEDSAEVTDASSVSIWLVAAPSASSLDSRSSAAVNWACAALTSRRAPSCRGGVEGGARQAVDWHFLYCISLYGISYTVSLYTVFLILYLFIRYFLYCISLYGISYIVSLYTVFLILYLFIRYFLYCISLYGISYIVSLYTVFLILYLFIRYFLYCISLYGISYIVSLYTVFLI